MKNKKIVNALTVIFFLIYFLILSQILFFKNVSPGEILSPNRELYRGVNIIPFATVYNYYFSGYFNNSLISNINIIGNIIIFIPLGLFIGIYFSDKILKPTFSVFMISTLVEITQYVFGLGISDVDDIILNTIGGFIGIILYRFLFKVTKDDKTVKLLVILSVLGSFSAYVLFKVYLKSQGIKMKLL